MKSAITGLPLLSTYDPDGPRGTSIDPLGLSSLGDALAVVLVPGVRERQTHPRYLTALAVSHVLCEEFPDATLALDNVSEPWQVFEWYVVEGMVRTAEIETEVWIPGAQKARTAYRNGLPLSASRYLKTPATFGFHGVYRPLAKALKVEQADRLGPFGLELLEVWQKEQRLKGFYGAASGPGKALRMSLQDAVKKGLQKGATAAPNNWAGWSFPTQYLDPKKAGRMEAQLIWRQLEGEEAVFRKEILEFLVSKEGRKLLAKNTSERRFYSKLRRTVSADLCSHINTILCYERYCRLLLDAFEVCLYESTLNSRGAQPKHLCTLQPIQVASERLPEAFIATLSGFGSLEYGTRFSQTFSDVSQKRKPIDFVLAMYEHHKRIQKDKLPNGKAPWLEQCTDGALLPRLEHRLTEKPKASEEFVNPYRLRPLSNFAMDLRRL